MVQPAQKIIPRLRIAEKLDIKKSGALQATDLKSAAVREKVVQIIGGRLRRSIRAAQFGR